MAYGGSKSLLTYTLCCFLPWEKSYLSIEYNMPTIRSLWFIDVCPNRNAWYAPTFAVILLSIVVTAEHHVHRSRGLRHSHRTEGGVAGDHALGEDVELTVKVQVAIVIYSPVMLRWPLVCARNAYSWQSTGSDNNMQSYNITVTSVKHEKCL